MGEILGPLFASLGLIGAAYVTGRMALKLRSAEHRSDDNDARFWAVIDDLRTQLAQSNADRDKLQSQVDALTKDTNG